MRVSGVQCELSVSPQLWRMFHQTVPGQVGASREAEARPGQRETSSAVSEAAELTADSDKLEETQLLRLLISPVSKFNILNLADFFEILSCENVICELHFISHVCAR